MKIPSPSSLRQFGGFEEVYHLPRWAFYPCSILSGELQIFPPMGIAISLPFLRQKKQHVHSSDGSQTQSDRQAPTFLEARRRLIKKVKRATGPGCLTVLQSSGDPLVTRHGYACHARRKMVHLPGSWASCS